MLMTWLLLSQGFLSISHSPGRDGGHKNLGGDISWASVPNWPKWLHTQSIN